jgi:DNA-binding transcriptional regulator of glucitol operon
VAVRTKWLSRRALGLHAALVVVVAACGFLGWWQLSRALGGNDLSWVYTFEWPFFAVYGAYMWWKLLHEEDGRDKRQNSVPAPEPEELAARVDSLGFDPYSEEDPELAAYNRYLASLHAADAKGASRRPKATP